MKIFGWRNDEVRKKQHFSHFCWQALPPSHPKQQENPHTSSHLFADFGRKFRKIAVCFPQGRAPLSAVNTFFLRMTWQGCPHIAGFPASFQRKSVQKAAFFQNFSRLFFYLKRGNAFLWKSKKKLRRRGGWRTPLPLALNPPLPRAPVKQKPLSAGKLPRLRHAKLAYLPRPAFPPENTWCPQGRVWHFDNLSAEWGTEADKEKTRNTSDRGKLSTSRCR